MTLHHTVVNLGGKKHLTNYLILIWQASLDQMCVNILYMSPTNY